jgi:hypothetical protein
MSFDELYDIAPIEIKDYIDRCDKTPQSPFWHPEGHAGIHIRMVYDAASKSGDIDQMITAFFHDLGKADKTKPHPKHPGELTSISHELVSADLVKKYKNWIEDLGANYEKILYLVSQHMRIHIFNEMTEKKKAFMANHIWFDDLLQFSEYDKMRK